MHGTGDAVQVVLFDYRKVFDIIDHHNLASKLFQLIIPLFIKSWVFLTDREQRVKLSRYFFSEWGKVPSGVPQGTKLGPPLFILMINDLIPPNVTTWKYIYDTTVSGVVPKNSSTFIQNVADAVQQWFLDNCLELNLGKCKELLIYFGRAAIDSFSGVRISGVHFEVVEHSKILGLTISSNLKWNEYVSNIIKEANKRFYCSAKTCESPYLRHYQFLFHLYQTSS